MTNARESRTRLCLGQGIYYLASGLWPVFDRDSFEKATGPKADFWLVRTVGLLLATTGVAMTLAGARRRVTPEIAVIGAGTAASLAGIAAVYGAKGRISRLYLLDSLVHSGLAGLWISSFRK